jgi:hypothetical protein
VCLRKVVLIFSHTIGTNKLCNLVQFLPDFCATLIWYLQYSKFSPALKLLPLNLPLDNSLIHATYSFSKPYGVSPRSLQCL